MDNQTKQIIISSVLKEYRKKAQQVDLRTELAEIRKTDENFYNQLEDALKNKFAEIGKILKTLLRPASKGVRKGNLIFVQGAANEIYQIQDKFIKYIIRSIYDNFHDITNGVFFRMHMNELFSGDFILSLIKELKQEVKDLEDKKKEIEERYDNALHEFIQEGYKFDTSSYARRMPENVYNDKSKSASFWTVFHAFKARVKSEHPRVPEDKIMRYVTNDYSLKQEFEKIKEDFLSSLPEYVDYKKRQDEYWDKRREEINLIQDQIDKELKQLDYNNVKKAINNLITRFTSLIAGSIASGKL